MGFTLKSHEVKEVKNLVDSVTPDMTKMADKLDNEVALFRRTRKIGDATRAAGSTAMLLGLSMSLFTGGASLALACAGAAGAVGGQAVASLGSYFEDWYAKEALDEMEKKYSSMRAFKAFKVFVFNGIKKITCRLVLKVDNQDLETHFRRIDPTPVERVLTMTFEALHLPNKIFELVMAGVHLMFSSTETLASRKVRTLSTDLKEVGRKIDAMEREIKEFAQEHSSTGLQDWDITFEKELALTQYEVGTVNAYV